MKDYIKVLKELKPFKVQVALNIIFNLMSVLFNIASISLIIPLTGLLFGTQEMVKSKPQLSFSVKDLIDYFNYSFSKIIIEEGYSKALIALCLFTVIIFVLKNTTRFLALYFLAPIRNGVVRNIRSKVFEKIIHLRLAYFTNNKKGDVLARVTSDVQEVEWSILSTLETMVKEPLTILGFLGAMLYLSPQLTLFVFILLIPAGFLIGRIAKNLKNISKSAQHKMGEITSFLEESISGLKIIKAFNAEQYRLNKFYQTNNEHASLMTTIFRRRGLSSPLSETMGFVSFAIVLWYGGRLILTEGKEDQVLLQPQEFIGFLLYFGMLINPAKAFSNAFYLLQKGLASFERIQSVLNAEVKIYEADNPKSITKLEDNITFNNISFSYQDEPTLKNINLKIPKGSAIAFFGPSGSGKSTLVNLLLRFYDVREGEISLDGEDIRNLKLDELRKMFGYVTQEPVLFNDTIANNIAFGLDNIKEEDIINAAKTANAHEFIVNTEHGYQTNVGEGGSKLSGGQRQRITIARAILRNPPILIMDEATSALDAESEKLVQDAIGKIMKNRTSIIIAHRFSTIQYADSIALIQDGEIKNQGTHVQLMEESKLYRNLVELQAF